VHTGFQWRPCTNSCTRFWKVVSQTGIEPNTPCSSNCRAMERAGRVKGAQGPSLNLASEPLTRPEAERRRPCAAQNTIDFGKLGSKSDQQIRDPIGPLFGHQSHAAERGGFAVERCELDFERLPVHVNMNTAPTSPTSPSAGTGSVRTIRSCSLNISNGHSLPGDAVASRGASSPRFGASARSPI
jgi:hypothetical protein